MSDDSQVKIISPDNLDELPDGIREKISAALGINVNKKNPVSTIGSFLAAIFLSMRDNPDGPGYALLQKGIDKYGENTFFKDMADIAVMAAVPVGDDRNYKFGSDGHNIESMCLASGIEMLITYVNDGPSALRQMSNFERAVLLKVNCDRYQDAYSTGRIESDIYNTATHAFMEACLRAAYSNTMEGYMSHKDACSKGLFQSCANFIFERVKNTWTKSRDLSMTGMQAELSQEKADALQSECRDKAREILKTMAAAMWLGEGFLIGSSHAYEKSSAMLAKALEFLILEKSNFGTIMAAQHLHNKIVEKGVRIVRSEFTREEMLELVKAGISDVVNSGISSLDGNMAAKAAATFIGNVFGSAIDNISAKAELSEKDMVAMADAHPELLFDLICPHMNSLMQHRYREIREQIVPSHEMLGGMLTGWKKERNSINV